MPKQTRRRARKMRASPRSKNRPSKIGNTSVILRGPSQIGTGQTTRFVQWESNGHPLGSSSSATGNNTFKFSLSLLPQASSIAGMWDQYRIVRIDCLHIPQSFVGASPGTQIGPCFMYVAVDYDDNTTTSGILQFENMEIYSSNEKWTMSFVPRASTAVYSAGAFAGYALTAPDAWIDSDNTAVPYYGLKIVVPQVNSGAVQSSTLFFRYHLECRSIV